MRFSEHIHHCSQSPMRKFHTDAEQAKGRGIKIYHLNIGQPDIETPRSYFEAIRGSVPPTLAYAPSPGIPALISQITRYYRELGADYAPDDVLITAGGSEALSILMNCILDPGSEVIIPEPFYPNYHAFVEMAGGVIRPLPTKVDEGYAYADREKLEALINSNTRAILFTNPGNPTGAVLSEPQMRMIADVAKAYGLFVIGDEVYREFVYGGEQLLTIGMYEDIAENAVVIDSVSKRFSACGARIGALITKNKELRMHALKLCQSRLSVATQNQMAAAALYDVEQDYFSGVRNEYKLRRDTIYRRLSAMPGVVCTEPKGAFYVMAKLPVEDTDAFQKWLLTDFQLDGATIMFAPGAGFYATPGMGTDEVRLAYVLCASEIEKAMDVLEAGIQAYNHREAYFENHN
ncbi:MAG: pyridoxal phosphate-dependent aminotransferase [Eubacteriales bacterium]|nr:pyridoxal phosphate-dependent aminotransferase [Eubacteriales bacterium]